MEKVLKKYKFVREPGEKMSKKEIKEALRKKDVAIRMIVRKYMEEVTG